MDVPSAPTSFFAYDVLKAGTPEGVDPSRKEQFLEDAVFQKLFGSSKEASFAAQPKWKQSAKKKELGLF